MLIRVALSADHAEPCTTTAPAGSDRLMSQGLVNDDIAAELNLTSKTVRNYVSNVCAKLHIASRAQAVVRARDVGLE